MAHPARRPVPFPPARGDLDRRGWMRVAIGAIGGVIASVVGVVAGGAVLSPALQPEAKTWVPAGALPDLADDVPVPVTLRVTRQDGYYEAVDHQVVLLVKSDDRIRALSSTCTHLGCRVAYDPETKLIKCPCHGGVYAPDGRVLAGPPPRPLPELPTRIDGSRIFVRV